MRRLPSQVFHAFHRSQRRRGLHRLRLVLLQFIQVPRQLLQHCGLKPLHLGTAQLLHIRHVLNRRPQQSSVTHNLLLEFVALDVLQAHQVDAVQQAQVVNALPQRSLFGRRHVWRFNRNVHVRLSTVRARRPGAKQPGRLQSGRAFQNAQQAYQRASGHPNVPLGQRYVLLLLRR
jgi:hypothetical protein